MFSRIIVYTGIDIVFIPRIKDAIEKQGKIDGKNKFLKKVFSSEEIKYHLKRKSNYSTLAGRFAAKEAVIKSFSKILKLTTLNEIEVLGDIPSAQVNSDKLGSLNFELNVSISHDGDYAVANSVLTLY
jgi:holo-[acyl-carrier protein] synthase